MTVYISDLPLPEGVEIKQLRINQFIPKDSKRRDEPKVNYGWESLARMPLGVVPVEEDGSVYFEAPVKKLLQFQLLDGNGMAVQSMRSNAFVHPGEHLTCVGCHESKWEAPPINPNPLALQRPPSQIMPEAGGREPVNFHRLAKPVLEEKCAPCHQSQNQGPQDISYWALEPYSFYFTGGMVNEWPVQIHGGSRTIPGRFGALESRMGKAMLNDTHLAAMNRGDYSREDMRRIALWLDLNSNELGAYHNADAQYRGELVWPLLDVDPDDPLGVESGPVPGQTDVFRFLKGRYPSIQFRQQISISLHGRSLSIGNPGRQDLIVSILNLAGKSMYIVHLDDRQAQSMLDLSSEKIAHGLYAISIKNAHGLPLLAKPVIISR
jgi:hypothetical protein